MELSNLSNIQLQEAGHTYIAMITVNLAEVYLMGQLTIECPIDLMLWIFLGGFAYFEKSSPVILNKLSTCFVQHHIPC